MGAVEEQVQLINDSMGKYRQSIQSDIDFLNSISDARKKLDDCRNLRAVELQQSLSRMRMSWNEVASNIGIGEFREKSGPLVREDSQDTLNENLDIGSKQDQILELKRCNEKRACVDLHIEYTEYIDRNSKKIYQDWQANSLQDFHIL